MSQFYVHRLSIGQKLWDTQALLQSRRPFEAAATIAGFAFPDINTAIAHLRETGGRIRDGREGKQ